LPPMGYLFLILAMALNAAANVLLKIGVARIGALDEPGLASRLSTNYYLLAGLVLFAVNVVFYAAALSRLQLSVAYPVMMAGGVLIVVTVSILFLRESLSVSQMIGMLLVVIGLVLLTRQPLP
jgi:multidrug transporter EmrE-like cation transporter